MTAQSWGQSEGKSWEQKLSAANRSPVLAVPPVGEASWWNDTRALPTLPSVLFRFLGLVGDQETSNEALADFVCQDPALLSRVLPVLPHGFTDAAPAGPSLREAVSALGRDRLRALANTTPLIRSFEPIGAGSLAVILWERSLLCAYASQAAATFLGLVRPERYYVAGLLHDLGYLIVLQQRPGLFASVRSRWEQKPAGLAAIETTLFGASHCEIGASVARQIGVHPWFYPAIRNHHNPTLDDEQVSRVAAVASAFCSRQGLDLFPQQFAGPHELQTGFRARQAQTREMHEIMRGLFPGLLEIHRHRLLDAMSDIVRPVRSNFRETFAEWFSAGDSWVHPYRYARPTDTIAAVA